VIAFEYPTHSSRFIWFGNHQIERHERFLGDACSAGAILIPFSANWLQMWPNLLADDCSVNRAYDRNRLHIALTNCHTQLRPACMHVDQMLFN
jgi:hypothetical protein